MLDAAEQRKMAILGELARTRSVTVSDLSGRFGVSRVSIRHDLEDLEGRGLLRRIRGGAITVPQTMQAWSYSEKMQMRREQKARIGRAAGAMVRDGDVIIMDSGTTVVQVARHMPQEILAGGNLTVITSSMPIVRELGAWKAVHLIVLGGVYLPQHDVVVGPQAVANLAQLHANRMFLGADGLSVQSGATTGTVLDAEVDRASVMASEQVVCVADSSKIGRQGLAAVVPLSELDVLITDDGAPDDFVERVRGLGVEVRVV